MSIDLGQIAFEAYGKATGGKTYDGKPIPHWNDISAPVRNAWEAAAKAVEDHSIALVIAGSEKTPKR